MVEHPSKGGRPDGIGKCENCGTVYTLTETETGIHPIGTDGACTCGCEEFVY